jgi:threonine synthase
MKFVSTRGGAAAVDFSAALTAGLAPDGGLYVPAELTRLTPEDFAGLDTLAQVGTRLLQPFLHGDALSDSLFDICAEAFNFPVPLKALAADDTYLLELFHGPTAAFKDVGARFLAACMKRIRAGESKPLTILVATSGDTGAAVAAAFHGLPGLQVAILYPQGRVSPRQAHQLGCFGGNVASFEVRGSFDDCQALVKRALGDPTLQEVLPMSSANSISLGRWLPQMSYYAHAALEYHRTHRASLNFVVPTGNLGNAMAAILARAIGLPIGRIALATNANDVLPEFFAGEDYEPRDSVATLANAMDVGSPSNFERLRWLYPDEVALRDAFDARAVSDREIEATIRSFHTNLGEVLCPHTATAAHVLAGLREQGASGAWAIVATAHPAKFDSIVEPLIGTTVDVPPALASLLARPACAETLQADYTLLRQRLQQMAEPQ